MSRKRFLRHNLCVAICIWTAVLLAVQFSPLYMHTKTLTGFDGTRSYTVAPQADSDGSMQGNTSVNTPVNSPVIVPVNTQASAPVNVPASTQANTPVITPVSTPENVPVTTPTITPENVPTPTPINNPEKTPISIPTDNPTSTPESIPATTPVAPQKPQGLPLSAPSSDSVEDSIPEPNESALHKPTDVPVVEKESLSADHAQAALPPDTVQTVLPSDSVQSSLPVVGFVPPEATGETTVRPLRFGAQVTTYLPEEGDAVIYLLTVTERGSIQYTLTYPNNGPFTEIGWQLTLYESYDAIGQSNAVTNRRINIVTTNPATDTVTSAAIGVQPGTYRLVLTQHGAYSKSDVGILAQFTPEINREIEPNDTPARYTEIYPGHPVIGASSKYETATLTDADWYLLRMPYDGTANYIFTHSMVDMVSVAWQITLYDVNLNPLSFNNAAISNEVVTGETVGLAKGIYFVCVQGRVHSTQDYTLQLSCTPMENVEHESNDTFQTATPVATNVPVVGMMNNRASGIDVDYFAVDLISAGSLQVTFSHNALTEDQDGWNVSILDAHGTVLHSFVSNWMDTVNLSPEIGLTKGRYYIRVDSDNRYFTPEPYTLQIAHTADAGFEAEPNDTAEKASTMSVGAAVKGSLTQYGLQTDTDWFVVTIPDTANYTLTFTHRTTNLDRIGWNIAVYDADVMLLTPMDANGLPITDTNGAIVNLLEANWNQRNTTGYYHLRPGQYYVRVTAGAYFSSETYSVQMQKTR